MASIHSSDASSAQSIPGRRPDSRWLCSHPCLCVLCSRAVLHSSQAGFASRSSVVTASTAQRHLPLPLRPLAATFCLCYHGCYPLHTDSPSLSPGSETLVSRVRFRNWGWVCLFGRPEIVCLSPSYRGGWDRGHLVFSISKEEVGSALKLEGFPRHGKRVQILSGQTIGHISAPGHRSDELGRWPENMWEWVSEEPWMTQCFHGLVALRNFHC